jgi:hypothetical protein
VKLQNPKKREKAGLWLKWVVNSIEKNYLLKDLGLENIGTCIYSKTLHYPTDKMVHLDIHNRL